MKKKPTDGDKKFLNLNRSKEKRKLKRRSQSGTLFKRGSKKKGRKINGSSFRLPKKRRKKQTVEELGEVDSFMLQFPVKIKKLLANEKVIAYKVHKIANSLKLEFKIDGENKKMRLVDVLMFKYDRDSIKQYISKRYCVKCNAVKSGHLCNYEDYVNLMGAIGSKERYEYLTKEFIDECVYNGKNITDLRSEGLDPQKIIKKDSSHIYQASIKFLQSKHKMLRSIVECCDALTKMSYDFFLTTSNTDREWCYPVQIVQALKNNDLFDLVEFKSVSYNNLKSFCEYITSRKLNFRASKNSKLLAPIHFLIKSVLKLSTMEKLTRKIKKSDTISTRTFDNFITVIETKKTITREFMHKISLKSGDLDFVKVDEDGIRVYKIKVDKEITLFNRWFYGKYNQTFKKLKATDVYKDFENFVSNLIKSDKIRLITYATQTRYNRHIRNSVFSLREKKRGRTLFFDNKVDVKKDKNYIFK